ncbi:hypothetical protein VTK26DRAFT_7500 [Humicola hyalothermophila]
MKKNSTLPFQISSIKHGLETQATAGRQNRGVVNLDQADQEGPGWGPTLSQTFAQGRRPVAVETPERCEPGFCSLTLSYPTSRISLVVSLEIFSASFFSPAYSFWFVARRICHGHRDGGLPVLNFFCCARSGSSRRHLFSLAMHFQSCAKC